jgi:hypothetical protein
VDQTPLSPANRLGLLQCLFAMRCDCPSATVIIKTARRLSQAGVNEIELQIVSRFTRGSLSGYRFD